MAAGSFWFLLSDSGRTNITFEIQNLIGRISNQIVFSNAKTVDISKRVSHSASIQKAQPDSCFGGPSTTSSRYFRILSIVKRRLLSKSSDFDDYLFQLTNPSSGIGSLPLDTFSTRTRYAALGFSFAACRAVN